MISYKLISLPIYMSTAFYLYVISRNSFFCRFIVIMSSHDNHDTWLGYLIAVIVSETMRQAMDTCPGCTNRKNSALLHSHQQSGLLEKLTMFLPSVKVKILNNLQELVVDYVNKFENPLHSDETGMRVLRGYGKDFVRQLNDPKAVYYSRYLIESVDEKVHGAPLLGVKPMTMKRVSNTLASEGRRAVEVGPSTSRCYSKNKKRKLLSLEPPADIFDDCQTDYKLS